jgi:hypothetical protein
MIRCAEKQANYSKGNKGKEKFLNGTQIGTQIERGLVRKNAEDEDVIKAVEVALELETFDAEKYVRRIQESWPKSDYSPLCEHEILRAFEFESEQRKWPRIEAASYVTERIETRNQ